jgi:CBS domain-containing protein
LNRCYSAVAEKGKAMKDTKAARMILEAATAKDLMCPNPVSIDESATIREGVAFLVDKGFSAAPVIDRAGRPVGVLSRADVLVHDREQVHHLAPPEYYRGADLATQKELTDGFQIEEVDQTSIKEIMTPVVYSVLPEAPVTEVINQMVGLKVHRLFVVDADGVLVGVISTMDVLNHLRVAHGSAPVHAKSSGEYASHLAEIW